MVVRSMWRAGSEGGKVAALRCSPLRRGMGLGRVAYQFGGSILVMVGDCARAEVATRRLRIVARMSSLRVLTNMDEPWGKAHLRRNKLRRRWATQLQGSAR